MSFRTFFLQECLSDLGYNIGNFIEWKRNCLTRESATCPRSIIADTLFGYHTTTSYGMIMYETWIVVVCRFGYFSYSCSLPEVE